MCVDLFTATLTRIYLLLHSPEIRHHKRVLEFGISARVEAVHPTEPLARRSSAEHLHVALLRQPLAKRIRLLSRHDQLQQDVTVFSEHCSAGVVEPEGLCCRLPHLYGPLSLTDTLKTQDRHVFSIVASCSPVYISHPCGSENTFNGYRGTRIYQPGGSLQKVLRSQRTRPVCDIWSL